jgi:hypothetical protein
MLRPTCCGRWRTWRLLGRPWRPHDSVRMVARQATSTLPERAARSAIHRAVVVYLKLKRAQALGSCSPLGHRASTPTWLRSQVEIDANGPSRTWATLAMDACSVCLLRADRPGTQRERLTGRKESVSLARLRSDATCTNGG